MSKLNKLEKKSNMSYNKAKRIIDDKISEYIHHRNDKGTFLVDNLSIYASISYGENSISEVVAESFSAVDNPVAEDILKLIEEELK